MMFEIKNLLTLVCIFCFLGSKAQNATKETIVAMQLEAKLPTGQFFSKTDTFLIRNDFILEPIGIMYSNEETNLSTGVSREISAGKRLKGYNLTNYREMIGMSFDVGKKISAKTIETYRVSNGNKLGMHFVNEPYLGYGFSVSDFTKDKDTIINGAKCILIKNNKVSSKVGGERILQLRIAINPLLKSFDFPIISEKIVKEFGGGAIVYAFGITQNGFKTTVRYHYNPFTSVETSLFDHYQALYNSNLAILDKYKKMH